MHSLWFVNLWSFPLVLLVYMPGKLPAKLALMLEISRTKIYTDGLKIFRSQELLPVSLETRVQYGGGDITRSREFDWMRLDSALKKVVPDISRPQKKSFPIYLGPKNLDTILMHWMSVKMADNFQIREHS